MSMSTEESEAQAERIRINTEKYGKPCRLCGVKGFHAIKVVPNDNGLSRSYVCKQCLEHDRKKVTALRLKCFFRILLKPIALSIKSNVERMRFAWLLAYDQSRLTGVTESEESEVSN